MLLILFALLVPTAVNTVHAAVTEDYVREHAARVERLDGLPARVARELANFKVVTVGEVHGTEQSPAFVAGLARLLSGEKGAGTHGGRRLLVGLEIWQTEQERVERYAATGDPAILQESPFFQDRFQDGRRSVAMAALLRELGRLPNVRIVCFDSEHRSGQDRDTGMAITLREAWLREKPDQLLMLAGNIHASLAQGGSNGPDYRPAAYELHARPDAVFKLQEMRAIRQRNLSGDAWVCEKSADDCGIHAWVEPESTYSRAVDWSQFFVGEPAVDTGYDATLFVRELKASPPFKGLGN